MADTYPTIFSEDISSIQSRIQTRLEAALGRALSPSDIEMLIANCFAYELQLFSVAGNKTFRQNLVHYATDSMLEYLATLVGVTRLAASAAECTIRFNIVDVHNAVQLPAGIRVQSIDGNVIFITNNAVDIPIGVNSVDVTALCQDTGTVGNDYDAGKISIILDPQPFITDAANIDTTNSGTDAETDDNLRDRIQLAPSSFSVAGPKGAYEYFAKTANSTIVDVNPVTTNPGEVTLYILCNGGTAPSAEILAAVLSICSDTKVRPQNDTVKVSAPTIQEYDIIVELTTYTGAINSTVQDAVNSNLAAFQSERNNKLGMDVIRSQISALSMIKDSVYDVNVVSPAVDIIADDTTYTKCTGITITITGSNDG